MKKIVINIALAIMSLLVGSCGSNLEQSSSPKTTEDIESTSTSSVLAEETDEGITPRRAPVCQLCGGSTILTREWTTDWFVQDEVECTHKPYGTDLIYQRNGLEYYKCTSCGTWQGTHSISTQKTECHGYYAR